MISPFVKRENSTEYISPIFHELHVFDPTPFLSRLTYTQVSLFQEVSFNISRFVIVYNGFSRFLASIRTPVLIQDLRFHFLLLIPTFLLFSCFSETLPSFCPIFCWAPCFNWCWLSSFRWSWTRWHRWPNRTPRRKRISGTCRNCRTSGAPWWSGFWILFSTT